MLKDRLSELLEPVVAAIGFDLLLLEYSVRNGSAMLRLYIDHADGITLDHCERVSREVAAVLDVEDVIPTAYRLEVSSPGFDRPLVKPAHYARFVGAIAKIQTLAPLSGRRRFQGKLLDTTQDAVNILTEDGAFTIPFADIDKARLVPNFDEEMTRT